MSDISLLNLLIAFSSRNNMLRWIYYILFFYFCQEIVRAANLGIRNVMFDEVANLEKTKIWLNDEVWIQHEDQHFQGIFLKLISSFTTQSFSCQLTRLRAEDDYDASQVLSVCLLPALSASHVCAPETWPHSPANADIDEVDVTTTSILRCSNTRGSVDEMRRRLSDRPSYGGDSQWWLVVAVASALVYNNDCQPSIPPFCCWRHAYLCLADAAQSAAMYRRAASASALFSACSVLLQRLWPQRRGLWEVMMLCLLYSWACIPFVFDLTFPHHLDETMTVGVGGMFSSSVSSSITTSIDQTSKDRSIV